MTSQCINGACGYYGIRTRIHDKRESGVSWLLAPQLLTAGWRDQKASKTSTPSVIKLSGGGTGGGGEQLSPGSGPPPPASPIEHTDTNENNAATAATKHVDSFPQNTETTMSFVLQLGTVETSLEKKNASSQPPSSSLNQEETSNAIVTGVDDTGGKPQILQCLENTADIPASHVISFSAVKSVSVTYPVAKAVREVQRITGSQTNTTQVLSTRVVSQKLPVSGNQTQSAPLTLNASSNVVHVPVNAQSLPSPGSGVAHVYPLQHTAVSTQSKQQTRNQVIINEAKQQQQQQQQTTAISSLQTTSMPLKVQQVSSQLVVSNNAVRAITSATSLPNIQRIHVKTQNLVGQAQTVNLQKVKAVTNVNQGVTVQRNSVPRIQAVQKGQVSAGTVQTTQFAVNQVTNNSNIQRTQQANSTLQKTQTNAANAQKVSQVYNNQKVQSQALSSHPNHKAQLQQVTGNQQQGLQKLQVQSQKTVAIPRQPANASNAVNNVQKSSNSVAGIQKVQVMGQVQCQQQLPQIQKHMQVQPSQHQRSQSTATLQKSQTRSHSITNVHQKVATIAATIPNNQRTQVVNSKIQQQQMVMRVGVSKNQAQNLQQSNLKNVPQKIANTVKTSNSQNVVQQSLHRNASAAQPVKIIQQQQNIIGPQNAQKQPGCIKTIPPQKPVQRNHTQKVAGIKTSLNTNVTAVKNQGSAAAIAQKTSIKTLLPQQTVAANMLMHKNQPIKIQQQTIQQKQLVATSQFPQQVRQQSGQVKTLLPVTNMESRKDVENKIETELRESKEDERQQRSTSPVIRIPPPYECLQYVLQDHNYGAPPPRTPSPPSPPSHPKQSINGAGSSTTTSQHPYIYGKVVSGTNVDDDAASAISSETGRDVELEGEETETAPEGEGDDEDSVTRCICDFEHDDGYMICCDRCLVWQHVDCMGIDRSNIPDEYLCEICRPRRVDRQRARALQMRKREELLNSDTSSDTSSTSSADTDVGVNTIPKKRNLQQQIPRRKSEPSQRRDSHPRQSSAVRKKEATKRGPGKRKAKRRMSLEDKEEETQDTWGSNVAPLRQWIERYEEAVTNHYSPELRARISSIKVNGTHSDLRQSNMNVIATGKCRLNVHNNNIRFLVATMYLPPNTPVVELRGKYMLSTQHRPSYPQGRQHTQRPGPFVFFYRLPRDGTEVCVDTRTYGNDARFVRRSCKPNAEVKHCIEKGTLHLYIVTTTAIEKNAEITIRHEQHDLLLSPNPNGPMMPIVCACNNPRECQIVSLNQLNRRGSNGALVENADGRERRRRGRRNTICEDSDSSTVMPITTTVTNALRQVSKEELLTVVQQPQTSPNLSQPVAPETKKDKKKMTREERKMEAIMKAFERLEKAEQRKQEVQARNAQRKESGGTHSDNEDSHSVTIQSKQKQANSDRPLRRKRRKGRARTTSTSQSQSSSSRRTRLNSADSDESSGEESNSMQSPPLLNQNHSQNRDGPYSSHLHTPAKNMNENVTAAAHQGIPTAAGLLLALANSNAPGPSSPPLQQPTPVKSPTCDSGASSSSQSSTPSTPLSSACLLKRRIARESLSSDNYTPPTTPTMLDDFIEHLQSPLAEQNDERHITTESIKQEDVSHEHINSDEAVRQKLSIDIPQDFHIKTEKHVIVTQMDTSLMKEENIQVKKEESDETDCDTYLESKAFIKDELRSVKNELIDQTLVNKREKEYVIKKEENLDMEKGTVEIVDQNEGDIEMEDFSSPIAVMESDAILKQRVAEMRLEFGGSISEMVKAEDDRCDDDKRSEDMKCEVKSDDNMSIDEFDVEAQMKKITGDDGNDYKEKVDTSSEKDKSMDGIEGLMESSKEDSESEDKEMDDVKYESPTFKSFSLNHEGKLFKDFGSKSEPESIIVNSIKETEQSQESQKIEQPSVFVTSSEESIFESASSNMDTESVTEPPKIFHSIPPLSERIRKKTETTSASKSQLNFEAAIIESTIDMETVDESKSGEQKSMLSTALRELLEAKLDDLTPDDAKEEIVQENSAPYIEPKCETPEQNVEIEGSATKPALQNVHNEETPAKEEEAPPKEIKRLKDPRTVVPNSMPAPAFKPEIIVPVKRKLSISEYRKRKQQSSGTPPEPEPSSDASTTDKGGARGRSDSASSGTSSLSSDEEGSEEGTIGWSAAPTLVERQRENLTERLKREFGLFLSDDEEERARKHGLTAEAILKARKASPPHPTVSNTPPGYPVPQLPPQPYIPPPGSASIHYPQFQAKPCPVQYQNFTVPQNATQPAYTNAAPQTSANKQTQQFLVPQASQAPPGSNPYPPQFVPPSTTAVSISKYTSVTPPPPGSQIYPASGQSQKQFYNHPASRS
ncbi:Histone-lysine N-methyltransferase MLL5 [Melipona quadrifasciata]|uniref:Histone-lysine N-methyltransferase MLL5 n=1 Tax=Melipona quadrifasciata TaxID=166423 RepID=A0A0N0BCR3_9HYME|nr:Histone-lysine N-methyltransferase MLL5 [Melipona quadrifasciata]